MNYYITGDVHGQLNEFFLRIKEISYNINNGIIILGDSGFNWYGDKRDIITKTKINQLGCKFFIIRGNHDKPPFELKNISKVYNENIKNFVYYENEFPNIYYLIDGFTYYFNNYKCLVLGGAYSVDKEWRLSQGWIWFEHEQIPIEERKEIFAANREEDFDFVLSHTCPFSFQPTDLFLGFIDQTKVDNSMELWLEDIKNNINWKHWLFAHYHADRIEKPCVELFYRKVEKLDNIVNRWEKYKKLSKETK